MFETVKRIQYLEGMETLVASYGESIFTNDAAANNPLKGYLIYDILQLLGDPNNYASSTPKKNNISLPFLKNKIPVFYPRKYSSLDEAIDKDKIVRIVFNLAQEAHRGQKRHSGEDYFEGHIIPVGEYAVDESYNLHPSKQGENIASALGHDLVEDTDVTLEEIKKAAGNNVAETVKYLTKVNNDGTLIYKMGKKRLDIALLMGIDRKGNMFTLDYLPTKERRDDFSSETEQVHVPILLHHNLTKLANDLSMLVFLHNNGVELYGPGNVKYPIFNNSPALVANGRV